MSLNDYDRHFRPALTRRDVLVRAANGFGAIALGSLLDIGDGFGIDVFGDHAAIGADAAGGADAEPSTPGADVGDGAPRL